jgi:hypothetical protein
MSERSYKSLEVAYNLCKLFTVESDILVDIISLLWFLSVLLDGFRRMLPTVSW